MPLGELSSILWRERGLVARGICNPRLAWHSVELQRAVAVQAVVDQLHLDGCTTLRQLVARVPPPWNSVFREHYAALSAVDPAIAPRSLVDFLQ